MNPKVDFFFEKASKWRDELEELRVIALDSEEIGYPLKEELKWGCPCYTLNGNNIMLIHAFKEYCAYLFFKGALMKDTKGILIQQTENVQSARQVRFTSFLEIVEQKDILKAYIKEAVEIEKAGLKVELKKTEDFAVPEEFRSKLDHIPDLEKAFESLTPGRQRAYLFYFSQAKQSKTRESRIEKYMPKILSGKGLED